MGVKIDQTKSRRFNTTFRMDFFDFIVAGLYMGARE